MKLWVDDERPAPEGWVWAKTSAGALTAVRIEEEFDMLAQIAPLPHGEDRDVFEAISVMDQGCLDGRCNMAVVGECYGPRF